MGGPQELLCDRKRRWPCSNFCLSLAFAARRGLAPSPFWVVAVEVVEEGAGRQQTGQVARAERAN
eukprot:9048911-Lingulodinium_polyedra.AAC.1